MSAATPIVSVAMLTYNQRDFIGQAIESVLAQEADFPIEIRIGDDFSTDGTRDILRRYKQAHPDRILLNLQPRRSSGIPGRVNNLTNLASCRGRYIALLDGDDFWNDPRKLSDQVEFLEANPAHAGACHDTHILYEPGGLYDPLSVTEWESGHRPPVQADLTLAEIGQRAIFHSSSFCFRASALKDLPPWFETVLFADWALFMLIAIEGPIRYESGCRSTYRRHDNSFAKVFSRAQVRRHLFHDLQTFWDAFPETRTPRTKARLDKSRALVAWEEKDARAAGIAALRWLAGDPLDILRSAGRRLRHRRKPR